MKYRRLRDSWSFGDGNSYADIFGTPQNFFNNTMVASSEYGSSENYNKGGSKPFSGKIEFVNFTKKQFKNYAIIPENGNEPFTPTENKIYNKVDGFYFKNPTELKYWYKIPNGFKAILEYDKVNKKINFKLRYPFFLNPEDWDAGYRPKNDKHTAHENNPFILKIKNKNNE